MDYLQNYLTQQSLLQGSGFQNQLLQGFSQFSKQTPQLSLTQPGSTQMPGSTDGFLKQMSSNFKTSDGVQTGNVKTPKSGGGGLASSAGVIGGVADTLGSLIPSSADNEVSQGINAGMGAASDALMAIPTPWTQIAGGAMKVAGFAKDGLDKITGGATALNNEMTTADKIMDSHLLGITPVGIVNSLTKKTVGGSDKDLEQESVTGYEMSTGPDDTDFGGFSRLFGGKKVKKKMKNIKNYARRTNRDNILKKSASHSAEKDYLAAKNSTQDIATKNQQSLSGNFNTRLLSAQKGAKLKFKNIIDKVNSSEVVLEESIEILSKGGTITTNVIPEGALHARKNNLEIEGITKKGIPVISYEEGDKVKQHAEVEVDEVILHISLTKQIEKLLKEFNNTDDKKKKDELAIKAGKLLSDELINNTEDNTGLIDKVA